MLNLKTFLVLTDEQKRIINGFGVLTKEHWSRNQTKLRKAIRTELMKLQNNICVYCGCSTYSDEDVEHIAHKADYPQFLFTPKNLAYSCKICNQIYKKSANVVAQLDAEYEKCEFTIVHPYLDDVDHFLDTGKFQIQKKPNLSPSEDAKAEATIRLLQYDQPATAQRRAQCYVTQQYCFEHNTSIDQVYLDKTLEYKPGL